MRLPLIPIGIPDNLRRYFMALTQALNESEKISVTTERGVGSVLLVSPSGSVYSVQVADDGTLSTTLVQA